MYTENNIEDRTITCVFTKLFYQKTEQFIQCLEFYIQEHTLDVAIFFLLIAQSIHSLVSVTNVLEQRIKGIVENTPPMTTSRLVTPTVETLSKDDQIKTETSFSFETHPNEHTKKDTSSYSNLQENHLELECQSIKEMIEEKYLATNQEIKLSCVSFHIKYMNSFDLMDIQHSFESFYTKGNYKKSSFLRNPTMQVKEFDCENYLLATDRIYATISDLKKLARNYEFEALEPMLSANEIPQRPPLLTVWPRFKTQNLEVPKVVAPPARVHSSYSKKI